MRQAYTRIVLRVDASVPRTPLAFQAGMTKATDFMVRIVAVLGVGASFAACGGGGDSAAVGIEAGATLDAGMDALDGSVTAPDAAFGDAATSSDAGALDPGADAATDEEATLLSETGLYADIVAGTLAPGVRSYTPRFELWSDGTEKYRFALLPPGTRIDTSDMDAWIYPVGTKLWKEFWSDGVRVETRLIHKRDDGPSGWRMVSFAWRPDQREADAVPRGVRNALGTGHHIPATLQCRDCHDGIPDRVLGFSAIQLAHDVDDLTLDRLIEEGWLNEVPDVSALALPGDEAAQAALGMLHANCGHCHNPHGTPYDRTDLRLWLDVESLGSLQDTTTYRTTVERPLDNALAPDSLRIAPGDVDRSALYMRMQMRGDDMAMPPIASEDVDEEGLEMLRAWIESL